MSTQARQPAPAQHPASPGDGFTTGRLAQLLGAELIGPPGLPIDGPQTLDTAGPRHIAFIRSVEFARRWPESRAGAAVVSRGIDVPGHDPASRALLVVPSADLSLIQILEAFAPPAHLPPPGVHSTALVDPTAEVAASASIGPHCSIGPGSRIGEGAVLGAGVRIGRAVRIGARCTLHANVVIQDRCTIGDHCILHPGVVIGADGFGYHPRPDGRGLMKVPHIGTVEIGTHVEIGANSCIDRGKIDATTIGDGTKIDNLVQIGHNCRIGRSCIICGLSGLAGSVTVGDGAILGGQSGVADNSTIGAGARLGAMSGVKGTLPAGESWLGAPARPAAERLRNWAAGLHLAEHVRTLRRVEAIVDRELVDKKPAP